MKPRDVCRKLEVAEGDYMHPVSRMKRGEAGRGQGGGEGSRGQVWRLL